MSDPETLVDLLCSRGLRQRNELAFTFLIDGETEEANITYGELDLQARAIGATLQALGLTGERALLLYPPGLDFIAAFFGCLYAGALAVPVYPPRHNRSVTRLRAIVADAQSKAVLTTAQILSRWKSALNEAPGLAPLRWIATDKVVQESAEEWQRPLLDGDALALLQYTSGSTGTPKGVMVSHHNLLNNERVIKAACNHTEESTFVGWLPFYHDMGLIGNVLQPLYIGARSILMSPVAFLQKPLRWLEAISRYRAATSGGPNFAYDLCVRKIPVEERRSLDLGSWTIAFNGAEPVRSESLERFAEAFEMCGFRREAFYPCYGMAEATLFITGGVKGAGPTLKFVDAKALEQHRLVPMEEGEAGGRRLVGCGRTLLGHEVVIVNPEEMARCLPYQVGEIWVSGPSVGQGYWGRSDETKRTFHAYLNDSGAGPFLRTGDLGFVKDGELFITGRLKDLVIIRGRNHYPQDIELTAEQSHPALRRGCSAAFAIEANGEEQLVVVQEIERRRQTDVAEIIEAIRQAIAEEHEAQVYAIALIKSGSISKTSSGKIQRHDCRLKFQAGSLDLVAEWRRSFDVPANEDSFFDSPNLHQEAGAMEKWLTARLAAKLSLKATEIDINQPIIRYGIDSMMAIELAHEIETQLGMALPLASILEASIVDLAAQSLNHFTIASSDAETRVIPLESEILESPLSYGQQALWFLYQLAPESAAYNLAHAVRIRSELNVQALRSAFQRLVDRHASLRTTFSDARRSAPVQTIHKYREVCFQEIDAPACSEEELAKYLALEANRPFVLEEGPLLRVRLFKRSSQEYALLLILHHIVADFWSLSVLLHELGVYYTAANDGAQVSLALPRIQYSDYVRWQTEFLAGSKGEALDSYWKTNLNGELPALNLPVDRPRPSVQTYRGASCPFRAPAKVTEGLKTICRNHRATLFMGLLASFQALLNRYTGQDDLLVGSLTSGRNRADLAGLVGYFVNPIALRADLSADPGFEEFLDQVRQTVLAAFEHQDYPFALLVERLQPGRDPSRSPLLQAMFSFQQAHILDGHDLALFALGEKGAQMRLGELSIESMALQRGVAQFELTFTVAEVNNGLSASVEYNTDLFDAATIERMAGHFCVLLEEIVANPSRRISAIPMLTKTEQRQMLVEWNETYSDFPRNKCLHELFEEQAERTPEAAAVIFEDCQLSYRELNRRANQLAHYLQRMGVGPEKRVGIFVERSVEMVVGLLGVLKAGGAYVPLDPTYPQARLSLMLEDAGVTVLLTQQRLFGELSDRRMEIICLDVAWEQIAQSSEENPVSGAQPENIAYVIYTSGSTGKPKGVMVLHRNVVNFCKAMDGALGSEPAGAWLAVTSMSFDISVLELLWTITRGFKVVIRKEQESAPSILRSSRRESRGLDFSLFYFASGGGQVADDIYKLLIEGAKFADQHGFSAVWTPERHFHAFGGLYPNPSVISAAIAAITQRVGIRAGSVVLPLHNPIRVAEEWSVVDNISKGRIGISLASGWHADDFVLAPENYADRKDIMVRQIETLRKLWRGEPVRFRGGAGNEIDVKILPRPVQRELPIWITAAGAADTFQLAGKVGAGLLTHLLGQSLKELEEKIKIYRRAWAEHHHGPGAGHVTLMLHTFIGEDLDEVREKVRQPFCDYLRSSISLIKNLAKSLGKEIDADNFTEDDMQILLTYAFDRYFQTSGLMGAPKTCMRMIEQVKAIGVDEVACLIDFGVDADSALASLRYLDSLRVWSNERNVRNNGDYSITAQMARHRVSHLQCTPSFAQMMTLEDEGLHALKGLKKLLLGGEALPLSLAQKLGQGASCDIQNMYGPTETTIWSTTDLVEKPAHKISIGRPLANTEVYIVDNHMEPVPVNVLGELYIGGEGVARGYLNLPELTAEKFVPNPFSAGGGSRLYKTGDLARYLPDGRLECSGRLDHQVKIRGVRVELGEIETILSQHPAVRETAALVERAAEGENRLIAYIVAEGADVPGVSALRSFLQERLPDHMTPSSFVMLDAMPLTPNGKIDRGALLAMERTRPELQKPFVAARNAVESVLSGIWAEMLGIEQVGVQDDFFELGGHSMLASQLVSRLRETFEIEFPLASFFRAPNVAGMAAAILENPQQRKRVEKIAELLISVAQYSEDEVEAMLKAQSGIKGGPHEPFFQKGFGANS